MSKRDYYPEKKAGAIMRLFWKAAGADKYILERSTYGDQIKYLCLGGIILATGLMAGLAGGYAFYTIFEPRGNAINSFQTAKDIQGVYDAIHMPTMIKAIIFGIIWGLVIFNIDRFIVTSTGKGDGTEDITGKELKGALPRIIMGAIIALTISKPVEIRMFKTEIDVKLHEKQIEQEQIYKAGVDSVFNSEIHKKETTIDKRLARISQLEVISDGLKGNIAYETGHGDCKSKCLEYKSQLAANEAQITSLKADPEYIRVKQALDTLEIRRKEKLADAGKVAAGLDGLLERIKIGHEISGWVISLFITLLFMAIELTPIFFKLMLIKSPYDYMEENIKELIKAENGIEIKANYYQDKEGHERDLVINHQVLILLKEKIQILEAQSQLSEEALKSWKEKKKDDVRQNPEDYINEEKAG
jgi:hypothetical protein